MFWPAIQHLWDAVRRFREWVQKNPWPVFLLAAGLLGFLWVLVQTIRLDNMGLRERSFWDWMELLIVPVALAAGVWWLNREGRKTEQEIAMDERHQGTLETYLDRMTELLLEKDLGRRGQVEEGAYPEGGGQDDLAASIARARTLAVLRTLDPARVSAVFRFLLETKVGEKSLAEIVPLAGGNLRGVEWTGPGADLSRADLSEADLRGAHLRGANLRGADLRRANLSEARLRGANLSGARLRGANLRGADLFDADVFDADLSGAYLSGANLRGADLSGAYLSEAHLSGAKLRGADLFKADLTGAKVRAKELHHGRALEGATMPDGTKYEEWIKRQETAGDDDA